MHAAVNIFREHPKSARARCGTVGEHRLLACSCRQPCRQHLEHCKLPDNFHFPISASCRDVQAGSLRSPDHGRGGGVGRTLGVACGLAVGVGLGVVVVVAVGVDVGVGGGVVVGVEGGVKVAVALATAVAVEVAVAVGVAVAVAATVGVTVAVGV